MMPFGLKNTGSKYQRLMDKEFKPQIGRNLEVYMDNLVIKSNTEIAMLKDVEETFKTLRSISMKLNPGKCSFGMEEGKFLGVIVTNGGFKANPENLEAVKIFPVCLNLEKLPQEISISINKRSRNGIPVNQVMPSRTTSADGPKSWRAIGSVPSSFRKNSQCGFDGGKKLCSNTHLLRNPHHSGRGDKILHLRKAGSISELSGRLAKWAIELGEHAIEYKPRPAIKGQVLADFIAEIPQGKEEECQKEFEPPVDQQKDKDWKFFTDGASNDEGAGAVLRITNPEGQHFMYAIRLEFKSTNNEAEYETLLAGLRIAKKLGAQHLEAHVDSMLVVNQIDGSYDAKDDKMVSYLAQAKVLIEAFTTCKVKHIKRSENKQADALSKLASVGFEHRTKDVRIEVLAMPSTMN
ncbi:uncharacterized protein LOC143553908 [Bidens hawaiensis]|uniref:uncharacterized protein LOC143553908 n=1 Tax=Bidens hawaiensis TaxID=980011 RepID=UPI0040497FBC